MGGQYKWPTTQALTPYNAASTATTGHVTLSPDKLQPDLTSLTSPLPLTYCCTQELQGDAFWHLGWLTRKDGQSNHRIFVAVRTVEKLVSSPKVQWSETTKVN